MPAEGHQALHMQIIKAAEHNGQQHGHHKELLQKQLRSGDISRSVEFKAEDTDQKIAEGCQQHFPDTAASVARR